MGGVGGGVGGGRTRVRRMEALVSFRLICSWVHSFSIFAHMSPRMHWAECGQCIQLKRENLLYPPATLNRSEICCHWRLQVQVLQRKCWRPALSFLLSMLDCDMLEDEESHMNSITAVKPPSGHLKSNYVPYAAHTLADSGISSYQQQLCLYSPALISDSG